MQYPLTTLMKMTTCVREISPRRGATLCSPPLTENGSNRGMASSSLRQRSWQDLSNNSVNSDAQLRYARWAPVTRSLGK